MVASENTFFSTLSLHSEKKTWRTLTIVMSSTFSFNKLDKSTDLFLTHSVFFLDIFLWLPAISSNIV